MKIAEDRQIANDLYFKSTDTHYYLNLKSSHPKHIKLNIPFNIDSRIITIVNTEETREIRLKELREYLRTQHYPNSVIENGIQKAVEKGPICVLDSREQPNSKTDHTVIPFVITYNPRNFDIFQLFKQDVPSLRSSEKMDTYYPTRKSLIARGNQGI